MSNKAIGSIILEGATTVEDTIITDGGTSKRVVAEGTLQDMDVENRNHRIYAKEDLEPEINGPRIKELLKAGYLCGEMTHPLSNDLVRQQTIDGKLVCVRYNDVWIEGNRVKARFQGTNNSYGETFDQDLRDGYKPAFSLRALGAIENIDGKAYVKGIRIITWDHVIYPSHRVAYTEKLITESANLNIKESELITPVNDPGIIIHLSENDARDVLKRLQRESANIDTILNTFEGIMDEVTLLENGKIRMTSRFGEKIYVNLEDHIDNLIMSYVFK